MDTEKQVATIIENGNCANGDHKCEPLPIKSEFQMSKLYQPLEVFKDKLSRTRQAV